MTSDPARNNFVLGTVQIGMTYGALNARNVPADGAALIAEAESLGIGILDTAQAYGQSEHIIGQLLDKLENPRFEIVSKIDPETDFRNSQDVLASARESVRRLGKPLYGLMYHDPSAVRHWNDGARDGLQMAREAGLCHRVGVSVYTPEEVELAISEPEIDIIQAPFNILDRRLEAGGLIDQGIARGCEVHLRSLFLQGLLLAKPSAIPKRLSFLNPWIETIQEICNKYGFSFGRAAIGYARQRFPEARLVIGCDDQEQLRSNVELFDGDILPLGLFSELQAMEMPPEEFVNPAMWPID